MVADMVEVGEESGQLAQVMEQVAPFFKEKMETMILKVTKMLEPLIIMGMGTSIAGLMLAIYMPDVRYGRCGQVSRDRALRESAHREHRHPGNSKLIARHARSMG